MTVTRVIGIGVLLTGVLTGSVYSQSSEPTDPKERQRIRDLVRRNVIQQQKLRNELHRKYGNSLPFVDDAGNELTYDEVVERVRGRTLASQSGEGDPADANGPLINFIGDEHDFGVVPEKSELVHRFTFKSTGTEPLVIEKVNTGCGCTVAKLSKHEYAAGEVGHIDITYKPKGIGPQSRTIQVLTNDTRRRITTLMLKVDVVPIVAARPTQLQFGNVPIGEVRDLTLEIVSRDPNLKVLGANINGSEFSTELVENAKPQGLLDPQLPGYGQVKVKLLGNADVGRLLRQLSIDVLASESEGKPQINRTVRVSVYAMISGHLKIEPPFVRIKPLQPEEEFEKETFVYHDKGEPFKILNQTIKDSNIDADVVVEPIERNGRPAYKITVKGKAGRVASRFRGKVVLTTDVERERVLSIEFSGLVRSARAGR